MVNGTEDHTPAISRVLRSRHEAQAAYDRLSRWYDWLAISEEVFNRRALAMIHAVPGETILEIGFGTGRSLVTLAGQGCRVMGADLSFGMARAAQDRLRRKRYSACALPGLGDAARLPYPDGCFDAVFSAFTLELSDTPEIPGVLLEARRVLRSGGRLGLVSLALPEGPGIMVRLYDWFHRVLPAYVDCRPIPVTAFVRQAGFGIQQAERASLWGLPVEMVVALKE